MGLIRVQFRRDTTANWDFHNPILLDGEMGYEYTSTNELRMKVGDGYYNASGILVGTHWKDLPYMSGPMGPIPNHEWSGTSLRFERPDRTWGAYVNLKGDTGPQGPQGPTGGTGSQGPQGTAGVAAGFGTPTATVDANVGTPSVTVTASGANTAKVFSFAFKNLKGATGAQGPQGAQGPTGATGATGTAAGFGTPTVTVDNNTGTPSCTITASGNNTAKVFAFAFKNLKGAKGDKGDTGPQGATGATGGTGATGAAAGFGTPTVTVDANVGTPSCTITASGANTAKVFAFAFKNLKGATGGTGPQGPSGAVGISIRSGMLYAFNSSSCAAADWRPASIYGTVGSWQRWGVAITAAKGTMSSSVNVNGTARNNLFALMTWNTSYRLLGLQQSCGNGMLMIVHGGFGVTVYKSSSFYPCITNTAGSGTPVWEVGGNASMHNFVKSAYWTVGDFDGVVAAVGLSTQGNHLSYTCANTCFVNNTAGTSSTWVPTGTPWPHFTVYLPEIVTGGTMINVASVGGDGPGLMTASNANTMGAVVDSIADYATQAGLNEDAIVEEARPYLELQGAINTYNADQYEDIISVERLALEKKQQEKFEEELRNANIALSA